jgi:hypothetical protein
MLENEFDTPRSTLVCDNGRLRGLMSETRNLNESLVRKYWRGRVDAVDAPMLAANVGVDGVGYS